MKTKIRIFAVLGLACMLGLTACSNDDEPMTKGFNDEVIPALPKMKNVEKKQLDNLFSSAVPVSLDVKSGSSYICDLGNPELKNKWSSVMEVGLLGFFSQFPKDIFIQNGVISMNMFQQSGSPHPLAGPWETYCRDMGYTIKVYYKVPTEFNPDNLTLSITRISNSGQKYKFEYKVYGFSGNELSMYYLERCAKYNSSKTEVEPSYALDICTYDTSKEMKKDSGHNLYFDNDREARDYMLRTLREKYGRSVPVVYNSGMWPGNETYDLDQLEKKLSTWDSVWD